MENPKINIPEDCVYKVHILNTQGTTSKVIVYSRNNVYSAEQEAAFQFPRLAEDAEMIYSTQQLLLDDSIRIIKKKILMDLWKNTEYHPSYNELYMFAYTKSAMTPEALYMAVLNQQERENPTLEEKSGLISSTVSRLLKNMGLPEDSLGSKSKYSLADFHKIKSVYLSQPIGPHSVTLNVLFNADPYEFNDKLEIPPIDYYENKLLLNYGEIKDNTIYVCLSEFVYPKYAVTVQPALTHTFFRLLENDNVHNYSELKEAKPRLDKKTDAIMTDKSFKLYNAIQVFHDIYHSRKRETQYVYRGIKSFQIQIIPEYNNILPLEIIFKSIHTSSVIPFIKYNPGERREKIYRVYYEQTSKDGKKIPFLKEKMILKLTREMGRSGQISMYISTTSNYFYVHFELNGKITIECDLKSPLLETELNNYIQTAVNPVFTKMNAFLDKTGFRIPYFDTLRHSSVQVVNMKYVAATNITNKINLKSLFCLNGVFNVYKDNVEEGAELRLKRVENYEEMNAKMVFINEKRNNIPELLSGLINNFQMSEIDAKVEVARFFEQYADINGNVFTNPGFPVHMHIVKMEDLFVMEIEQLTSIQYVEMIHIYFDSLVRITQQIRSSAISKEYLNDVCKGLKGADQIDKPHVQNVIESTKHMPVVPIMQLEDEPVVQLEEADEDEEGVFFDDIDMEDEYDNIDEIVESFNENLKHIDEAPKAPLDNIFAPESAPESVPASVPASAPASVAPASVAPASEPSSKQSEESGVVFSDDDDDEEGVVFSDDDDSQEGGDDDDMYMNNEDDEKYKANPTGMSLNNPNPFLKRMKQRDPTLFLTKKTGKYKTYSSSCQPINRQPVILTDEEKRKIDAEHPGSYHDAAIQYGTDPNKKYWYICPRYWCFLTNSSISKEDVEAGKCGKVIPDGATTIPEGAYVYEFKTEDHFDDKGNYVQHYPGFALKKDLHPDGHCLPCCFKNWNSGKQAERKAQCMQPTAEQATTIADSGNKPSLYIISFETYPLDKGRWGFLPISAQLFVGTNYAAAVDKNNNKLIQPNTPVMLRYGVEQLKNQSFLGVFADVYAYAQRIDTPSVAQFKEILKSVVTIDIFSKIHNSSLITVFKPKVLPYVHYDKYNTSALYQRIDMNNPSQKQFLREIIASYENFIQYLLDDTQPIDHTYLWDLFTMNIPTLNKGINMVLLEVVSNDITDKINVVCPTNSYSSNIFDTKRDTVIVLKHDEFYEPVYMYKLVNGNIEPQKAFSEKTLYHNVKQMLLNVKYAGRKYCAPLQSLPKVFVFRPPILKNELDNYLKSKSYTIEKQVLNYQGKVIGYSISIDTKHIFIPCYPSSPSDNIPTVYMDETGIWTDYVTTRDMLQQIHRESGAKVPSKPIYKVIEDGLIVGIITETHQFVQVNPPSENVHLDNLLVLNNTDLNEMDKVITTSKKEDKKRVELVKHIHLETQFYSTFRSTIRKLLNDYEQKYIRDKIVKTIDNPALLYKQKLSLVESFLRTLGKHKIVFESMDQSVLMDLSDITECSAYTPDKSPYCIVKDDGSYQLVIPDKHLISGYNNDEIYYVRLADELIRYNRVRLFMFQPKEFLNIQNIEYSILPNEFIIIHTLLNSEYFRDLDAYNPNDRVVNLTHDMATPSITQTYVNDTITLAQQSYSGEEFEESGVIDCIKNPSIPIVGNTLNVWVKSFPKTAREMVFHNTPNCTYHVMINILKDRIKKNVTVNDIKTLLWRCYSNFVPKYLDKIVGMLKLQGKTALMEPVAKRRATLESLILSEGYPMSDLDIWMLATTFQLPIILITSTFLKGTLGKINWLKLGGKVNDKYYFVRSTLTSERNQVATYHLIYPNFLISDLGEFNTMMQQAVQGDPEQSKSILPLVETLERIEFISRK